MRLEPETQIQIGLRTPEGVCHWRLLKPEEGISRPTLLVLGGDGTTSAKRANGNAKLAEEILGLTSAGKEAKNRPFDLFSVYYENMSAATEQRCAFLYARGAASESVSCHMRMMPAKAYEMYQNPAYVQDFYHQILRPLITTSDGRRLATLQAQKNMRRITILAHCHGAYIAFKAEELMTKEMVRLGYSREERDSILKQLGVITCAWDALPLGITKTTAVHFTSLNDTPHIDIYQHPHYSYIGQLRQYLKQHSEMEQMSSHYMAQQLTPGEHVWITNGLSRFDAGMEAFLGKDTTDHMLSQYLVKQKRAAAIPTAVALAAILQAYLNHSLQSEQTPEVIDFPPWDCLVEQEVKLPLKECWLGSHRQRMGTIIRHALSNGQRYPKTFCPSLSDEGRRETAYAVRMLRSNEEYAAARYTARNFHQLYPFFKTALRLPSRERGG